MTLWRCHRPFCGLRCLAWAVAAVTLLTPASLLPVRAQAAQTAALAPRTTDNSSPSSAPSTNVAPGSGNATAAAVPASLPPQNDATQQKGLAARTIDKVKQAAKSASDIFSRVACLPPKGEPRAMGSLPHVAGGLASGRPVVIVAFGSSSTQGYG